MKKQNAIHAINLAHAANQRGDFATAKKFCKQALRYLPDMPEAWYNQGIAMSGLGNRAEALRVFEQARQRTLQSADAQNAIGLALLELDADPAAERCLQKAIALSPEYPLPYVNLGKLRQKQKRPTEALDCFMQAINLQPELAPAYANMAGVLNELKRHKEAEQVSRQAIALDASLDAAWNNLCAALIGLKHYQAAETICRKTLELNPEFAKAWENLGEILSEQQNHTASANCYQKALALDPDAPFLRSNLIKKWMQVCHWEMFHQELPTLLKALECRQKASDPFIILGLVDNPRIHQMAAEIYAQAEYPEMSVLPALHQLPNHDRIRIGYYSADFHDHATTYLMAELFEQHDKSRFEIIGFSFGPDKQDAMRKRVTDAFDQFYDVRDYTDKAVAMLSRELEIDIAVDLKGYTKDCRTGIFAYRAAPIQVNYLGFPGTMGCSYMDYLIADPTLIPEPSRQYYHEKIVYLPHSYQVNDSKRVIADTRYTRRELGLPDDAFVFCCFNNNYKITPNTFDSWMRILQQVEGSVLWLFEDNPTVGDHLRKEALRRGIAAERLVFAQRLQLAEHLARHQAADLFLDTLPYNAHTTTSDALWAGLPVLTCMGSGFAGRVAASLLNAIHLPELITTSQADYEALATQLAHESQQLQHIRMKLAQNRLTTPLFNARLFTQHLETAYVKMYERGQQALPIEHMTIEP